MLNTVFGIYKLFKAKQFSNALAFKYVTFSGNIMSVSFEHPAKHEFPIILILLEDRTLKRKQIFAFC